LHSPEDIIRTKDAKHCRIMIVVLNGNAGGTKAKMVEGDAVEFFRQQGVEVRLLYLEPGMNLKARLEEERVPADGIVVAGGGDGTISAVAHEVAGTRRTLGVLPLGTLNHFAKDLGIPLELEEAVKTVVHGQPFLVDVGEVNGRIFVNNSGLGLYPEIVAQREVQQERQGRGKWPAFARAVLHAFRRYPFLILRVSLEGQARVFKTAFVFVGNNEYQISGLDFGGRTCLNNGKLGFYLGNRTGRLGLLRLAGRALVGRLNDAKDFEAFCIDHARIESGKRKLLVSTDGEVYYMKPPLEYRIRPGALRVMAPAAKGGE
jgi:diacylglycerol kinase family enzyme